MNRISNHRVSHRSTALFVAAFLLTAIIYWPGLRGDFLFDDFPNIVDNNGVHVTQSSISAWKAAALASPSADLRRPLAMLSFAVNEYCSGNTPFAMKLTNLVIHLLNGVLLFLMLRTLLCIHARINLAFSESTAEWTALWLASAWLLAPINLTGVLYVVQRMESLAQLFVLLGLWRYFAARSRQLAGSGGEIEAALALILCTIGGVLNKESAVLLPLYAFLAEYTIIRFRARDPRTRLRLILLYTLILLIPAVIAIGKALPRFLNTGAYSMRPFTLAQRLMTEPRILFDYAGWTLLPIPSNLGFYHDDISTSTSWLSPPSTLVAIFTIGFAALFAILVRRKKPLISLGILWFFGAHLLTATVIPLELVYEHRNYFASIGVFLFAAGIIMEWPLTRAARVTIAIASCALYAGVCAARAHDWSNPLLLAQAEAAHHPQSARANYEYGRMLVIASDYKPDSPLIPLAYQVLDRARVLPNASMLPESGLILLAGHLQQPLQEEWWHSMKQKLAARPPSEEDVSALKAIVKCQGTGSCPPTQQEMIDVFLAALQHEPVKPRLLAIYSDFAVSQLQDYDLGAKLLVEALSKDPSQTGMRIELADVLLKADRSAEAEQQLTILRQTPLDDTQKQQLAKLEGLIQIK